MSDSGGVEGDGSDLSSVPEVSTASRLPVTSFRGSQVAASNGKSNLIVQHGQMHAHMFTQSAAECLWATH